MSPIHLTRGNLQALEKAADTVMLDFGEARRVTRRTIGIIGKLMLELVSSSEKRAATTILTRAASRAPQAGEECVALIVSTMVMLEAVLIGEKRMELVAPTLVTTEGATARPDRGSEISPREARPLRAATALRREATENTMAGPNRGSEVSPREAGPL